MTHWRTGLITGLILFSSTTLAFDIPYGIQDPFKSPGFPMCSGGEIGYWQYVVRPDPQDPKTSKVWLILTTVDVADPAFVICWVPSDRKVLVMEPGKKL